MFQNDLSFSVCVSVFPSSCCHVFQAYEDKITFPKLSSSWWCGREAANIWMTCWQLPCQKAPNRLLHDVNKVKKTCKQSWHAGGDNWGKTIKLLLLRHRGHLVVHFDTHIHCDVRIFASRGKKPIDLNSAMIFSPMPHSGQTFRLFLMSIYLKQKFMPEN